MKQASFRYTMGYRASNSHPKHKQSRSAENVLVLQGGGSLGAFSCGVFKALVKNDIRFDIVAGTSIGGINAAIIAGSKSDHPEKDLEDFWIELAESTYNIIPDSFIFDLGYNNKSDNTTANIPHIKKISSASLNATAFGVPKMFLPRWNLSYMMNKTRGDFAYPLSWTYLYDNSPLGKTIERYINYNKLTNKQHNIGNSKKIDSGIRLIITCVNVLTAEPLIFDSAKVKIQTRHLLASASYPIYGFPWTEVEDGIYAWDGSLLSNTPVREVIEASPRNDKHIFIVENYPRKIDRLPSNMIEVEDRAKDIIFGDKTMHTLKMTRLITRQIQLIENLYNIFERSDDFQSDTPTTRKIKKEYNNLINNYGAEIHSVIRIIRSRMESPNISKNADFSPKTIKRLILEGEKKTTESIKQFQEKHKYE